MTHAAVNSGEKDVLVAIAPCRLFDLRPAPDQIGPRSAPLGAGETYTQPVRGTNGNCTIPADATAVAMNVTAVGGTAQSFLTIWPSDVSPRPLTSNLNWVPGSPPTPNKVDVRLSADGNINLFNPAGTVSVLADVVGYYADHNHDDRYYTKTQSDTQLATKANAADVYTKAQINALPSNSLVAGGVVDSNGTRSATFASFGSTWTVSKPGTGSYGITIPGLNPGCGSVPLPVMTMGGSFGVAGSQWLNSASTQCFSGDVTMNISTANNAGTATDLGFSFMAYAPSNVQLLPASAARQGMTECTTYVDGTVTCH